MGIEEVWDRFVEVVTAQDWAEDQIRISVGLAPTYDWKGIPVEVWIYYRQRRGLDRAIADLAPLHEEDAIRKWWEELEQPR